MVRQGTLIAFVAAATLLFSCAKEELIELDGVMTCGTGGSGVVEKMNGVSFEGPVDPITADTLNPMLGTNANWVTFMPFGFTQIGDPSVGYNYTFQWWGEKSEGVAECTAFAHQKGLKVMIKPQIWVQGGVYTGDIGFGTPQEWMDFEADYLDFILEFAHVADSMNAEAFCIGTELKTFIQQRPMFWGHLIDTVKTIYDGQLTYAGNWDSYTSFAHWDKMDFIGIDAYFPLSDSINPSLPALEAAWDPWIQQIKTHAESVNKPVVFTEYGYRSMNYATQHPWDSSVNHPPNLELQRKAYQALFNRLWDLPWFRGGFLWKWHALNSSVGGPMDNDYTPQNKPVLQAISNKYGQY